MKKKTGYGIVLLGVLLLVIPAPLILQWCYSRSTTKHFVADYAEGLSLVAEAFGKTKARDDLREFSFRSRNKLQKIEVICRDDGEVSAIFNAVLSATQVSESGRDYLTGGQTMLYFYVADSDVSSVEAKIATVLNSLRTNGQ